DFHGDMETYFAAKRKLFVALAQGRKPGRAVINIDDPAGARLAGEGDAASHVTYGLGPRAEGRATRIQLGPDSTRMMSEATRGTFPCTLPLIGRHNVYNALAAAGTAMVLEVASAQVQTAIASMPPVPGRLERISQGQPFGVFVDYAHTDDALRNVLT